MTPALSPNTQTILLLTAPLIAGSGPSSPDLLSPGEYNRLARHLRELQHQPADLVSSDAAELLRACQPVIDEGRLSRLLGRGFLLSQVIERWQARAIWVVSRADPDYPRRLKARLREATPAVLYGCGDIGLLDTGGLAVVGSRHVDDSLVEYTMAVGRLAARAGRTVVSGGAKGIDLAAMRGALEAGGRVSGVLAEGLEKTAMNREHRNLLLDGQLVLVSAYDPNAGFNVGHAMQRNKLIYALSDASLVVSSDRDRGGTWAGAIEQLDKLKFVPVYIRSTGPRSEGLDALRSKGAIPWPNPGDTDSFKAMLEAQPPPATDGHEKSLSLLSSDGPPTDPIDQLGVRVVTPTSETPNQQMPIGVGSALEEPAAQLGEVRSRSPLELVVSNGDVSETLPPALTAAEKLFAVVREEIPGLLKSPMKDVDVAAALDVSATQAKAWLQRLVDEGSLEKLKKPSGYVVKPKRLFED